MYIHAKTIKDKKGREVVLRTAEERDAENFLEYLKITTEETPFLIREPDEIPASIKQEQVFIKAKKESAREGIIIAEIDGKFIGSCSFMSISGYKRLQHRCEVGIALYKEFCGLGIGKAMMEVVFDLAKTAGYEQAELEVITKINRQLFSMKSLDFKGMGYFPII